MHKTFALPLIIALAAAAVPAAAQADPSPAEANQEIVVTGQKDSHKAIADFVKSLTPTGPGGQLSRFEHSVCPVVYGLAKPQAEAVASRIREVSKSVGIVVGGKGCTPNVVVAATADKRVFIEALRHDRAGFFGDMPPRKIRAMENSPEPAAAWQIGGPLVGADGRELYVDPGSGAPVNRTIESPSRLTVPVRPQFDAAIVVVEKRALTGLTTTQLADYAALRLLTGADPGRLQSAAPSILHVLQVPLGGEAPITMTEWDYSFLKGFYGSRRNLSTGRQRSAIGDTMEKQLSKPHGR
jgi:hypothetical protein